MCALFLRGVRGHAGARRRQQVGEVVCAIRSARRARQVDVDVGGLLLRPTDRRRRYGADSAGASMKAPDKKSGKSTTSTAAPPARAASFTSEAQAEGAVEKAPDKKSGESTSTAAPPAHAASFTVEAQTEGAVEKAPDKKSDESTSTAAPPKRMRQLLPVRLRSNWVGTVRPDKFAYSEADWQKIKASLARVGIDADAVTVPDRWWAHPDPAAALVAEPQLIDFEKKQWVMLAKRPLREQLQELAADYRGLAAHSNQGDSLTPRQEAAEIQEILNKLEAARAALNSRLLDFIPQ